MDDNAHESNAEARIDLHQVRGFLGAIYQPGDWFHILGYTEKDTPDGFYSPWIQDRMKEKGGSFRMHAKAGKESPKGLPYLGAADDHIIEWLRKWNQEEHLGVAASVGVYAHEQPRQEQHCIGMSALGIDIDPKEFEQLVPGAKTVVEVIPAVLQKLRGIGLAPHALVSSGTGLHVYLLMNRVVLGTEDDRARVKDTWWRLGKLLGGATDRFDLASVLRVPGSINWKYGTPKPVRFIPEYTGLSRTRYDIATIHKAVADLPGMPPPAQTTKKHRRAKTGGVRDRVLNLDVWDLYVLDVALKLDPALANAQARSRNPKTRDRSGADFAYGARLMEMGMPEALVIHELRRSAKGSMDGEMYVERTFSQILTEVWRRETEDKSGGYETQGSPEEAVYTLLKSPRRSRGVEGLLDRHRGLTPPPRVLVVAARPGIGKTRGLVELLAKLELDDRRWGFLGAFVRELLLHEFRINTGFEHFPQVEFPGVTMFRLYGPPAPPETVEQLIQRLPPEAAAMWPAARVRELVRDPQGFFINSRHPLFDDERLRPDDNGDEDDHADVAPKHSDQREQPMAVVKFRGRQDYCLAGHTDVDLRQSFQPPAVPLCATCGFTACRANVHVPEREEEDVDPGPRGAKTFWRQAPVGLMTHSAYETQMCFTPEFNDFEAVIVDELPAFIFRLPKLTVRAAAGRKDPEWHVDVLDVVLTDLRRVIEVLQENWTKTHPQEGLRPQRPHDDTRLAEATRIQTALEDFRANIVALARKRRHEVIDAKKTGTQKAFKRKAPVSHERRIDARAPILSQHQFRTLIDLLKWKPPENQDGDARVDVPEEPEDLEADGDDEGLDWDQALMVLRDFSSNDAAFDVMLEHSFDANGGGRLWCYRPVNGWPDLLHDAQQLPRDALLLDATAGIDPRYMLQSFVTTEERPPETSLFRTTVVLTSAKTMTKSKLGNRSAEDIVADIVSAVKPYKTELAAGTANPDYPVESESGGGLLVLTSKAIEGDIQPLIDTEVRAGRLPRRTKVDHFGNLRGRNDYRDFAGVYLTHVHQYQPTYYVGLGMLAQGVEGLPRQWASTNDRQWAQVEPVQYRMMVADLYQDVLRIRARSDPEAETLIFLPTGNVRIVARLLRFLRDANVVLPTGELVRSKRGERDLMDWNWEPEDDLEAAF